MRQKKKKDISTSQKPSPSQEGKVSSSLQAKSGFHLPESAVLYLILLLFLLSLTVMWVMVYPESLRLQEGNAYFLFTREYFLSKLNMAPALTAWIEDFLFQFYRWPIVGAIIQSLLLGLTTIICMAIPKAMKRETMKEMALMMPIALISFFTYDLGLSIEAVFFMVLLYLYVKVSIGWGRLVLALFSATIGFGLMNHPIQILLLVCMTLLERFHYRTKLYWSTLSCIALCLLVPQLYSQKVCFLPFTDRFFHLREVSDSNYYLYIGMYLLTLLLVMVPFRRLKGLRLAFVTLSSLCSVFLLSQKEVFHHYEKCYRYISLTDKKDWEGLKKELRKDGMENAIRIKYALLAESAEGTLGENLFSYSINDPEDFLYRKDRTSFPLIFNRQFYATLGIYDEAMHQAMEYSLQETNGNCFSAMRDMIDYSIEEADFPVARKYLSILDKSLFHHRFVSDRLARIKELEKKGVKPETPLRKDDFVGGYPFNSEMVRQAQLFPDKQGYIDYLLCGLLLQKKLNFFQIVIHNLPYYKQHPLPKAFAEAAALVEAMGGKMRDAFQYPEEYDIRIQEYLKDKEDANVMLQSKYADSYWNYYFFVDIPVANEQMMQSSKGHG